MKRIVTMLVLLATFCLSVHSAWAVPRNFPANTLRGVLTTTVFPQVTINGQAMQLAPGAKIYSQQNTILVHTNLTGSTVIVNYTVDAQGYVSRVWILTQEELALPPPGQH